MKKVLAIVLSLVMVLSLGTAAFAAEQTITQASVPQTGSATAWYEMEVAYVVTYPDDIEVAANGDTATEYDFTITGAKLVIDKTLNVTVASTNSWKLVYEEDADVKYDYTLTMAGDCTGTNGSIDLEYVAGDADNQAIATLSAELNGDVEYVGRYEDTLTFTVAINDAP